MYLVGAPHPHKDTARRLLEQLVNRNTRLVTDAEVLQEILHRYVAIDRRVAIQPAFDAILNVVDHVYPVSVDDIQLAKSVLQQPSKLSARDAVHLAIMQRYRIDRILTFDAGFDGVPGVERVRH